MQAAAATAEMPPITTESIIPLGPASDATNPAGIQVKKKAMTAESVITITPAKETTKVHTFSETRIGLSLAALPNATITVYAKAGVTATDRIIPRTGSARQAPAQTATTTITSINELIWNAEREAETVIGGAYGFIGSVAETVIGGINAGSTGSVGGNRA